MATFAPNYSNRYFVKYRAAGREHRMSFRYDITPADPTVGLVAGVENFLQALLPALADDFVVSGAEFIRAGQTSAFPAPAPSVGPGTVAWTKGDSPRFHSFTGKGITAQPAVVYVYGATTDPGQNSEVIASDYRIYRSESAVIAAALDELAGIPDLTTIDGAAVIWNQYANVAYNSYYQRKARRG